MTTDQFPYALTFTDGCTIVRKARKQHHCSGGHNGETRLACHKPILKGDTYIEYLGESPAFQSGYRYHVECALQQGLLQKVAP